MEQTPTQAVVGKKHSPILCALFHLLIFCGAYLYLRLYKRFFIFFAIMIVAGLIPVPYLTLVILVVAMVDTYFQTKGINDGTIQKEPFNNLKHVGGSILIILAILASFLGYTSYLAWK